MCVCAFVRRAAQDISAGLTLRGKEMPPTLFPQKEQKSDFSQLTGQNLESTSAVRFS